FTVIFGIPLRQQWEEYRSADHFIRLVPHNAKRCRAAVGKVELKVSGPYEVLGIVSEQTVLLFFLKGTIKNLSTVPDTAGRASRNPCARSQPMPRKNSS
ncbi:MAG: hypothetical protein WD994_04965, partial [Pseudomonadales bacterium]